VCNSLTVFKPLSVDSEQVTADPAVPTNNDLAVVKCLFIVSFEMNAVLITQNLKV